MGRRTSWKGFMEGLVRTALVAIVLITVVQTVVVTIADVNARNAVAVVAGE